MGYVQSWDRKKLDTTEQLMLSLESMASSVAAAGEEIIERLHDQK